MTRPPVTEFFTAASTVLASWHGPVPRLRTGDEFGSYAEMRINEEFSYAGVRVAAGSYAVPTIDVTVQMACDGGIRYVGTYLIEDDGTAAGGTAFLTSSGNEFIEPTLGANEWITHTFHLTAGIDYDRAAVEACAATGTFAVVADGSNIFGSSSSLFVSQIDVIFGDTYRRNFQRDDRLGANSARNFGATSQQGSRRNFGYR